MKWNYQSCRNDDNEAEAQWNIHHNSFIGKWDKNLLLSIFTTRKSIRRERKKSKRQVFRIDDALAGAGRAFSHDITIKSNIYWLRSHPNAMDKIELECRAVRASDVARHPNRHRTSDEDVYLIWYPIRYRRFVTNRHISAQHGLFLFCLIFFGVK